jgi:hypothetical protein
VLGKRGARDILYYLDEFMRGESGKVAQLGFLAWAIRYGEKKIVDDSAET